MVLKIEKNIFLFEFSCWAESSARPSWPPHVRVACVAQPTSVTAQQFMGVHPHSEAESDPIASDPTR
jgi:hypothetical protein